MIISIGTRTPSNHTSNVPMSCWPIVPTRRHVIPGEEDREEEHRADRRASVRELLGGDHEVEDVAARAAVLLRERQAEQTGLADLRHELERVAALVVEAPVEVRRALPLDEVADH